MKRKQNEDVMEAFRKKQLKLGKNPNVRRALASLLSVPTQRF